MSILKRFLRAVYYFCVGVKTALHNYTHNPDIPRILRSPLSLVLVVVVVVAGGWGLTSALGSLDSERTVPAVESTPYLHTSSDSDASSSAAEESAPEPSESEGETADVSSSDAQSESSDTQSEGESSAADEKPEVDALVSATRFTPISDTQLTRLLKERSKEYYENPVFVPPAAGDIAGWKALNSDVFGWISISNTNINYPVVIGPYTDYYTSRGYYKEASRNGVIWADSDTQFDANGEITSRNTVLYGHNWTNCWRPVRIGNPGDVMFAQLAAYDNADFAAANPYIRLTTLGGDHLYQVFSVFYTDLSFGYNYADGAVVQSIINTAKSKSIHNFNVSVGANDQIITLSTCTRVLGPGDNQRFVVMAKKIS